jgi:diguanylate cyclase (GGDEF)-like protein
LGGDEFAILIPSCADRFGPLRLAAAIETAMQVPVAVGNDQGLAVSLSIGVAAFPEDGTDARALLQRADELMYAAKRSRVLPSLRPDPVPQR